MRYLPHTPEDIREMLEAIGKPSIDHLFQSIPEAARFQVIWRSSRRSANRP